MLGECQTLLLDVHLQAWLSGRWLWLHDPDHGYSVPLKVSIFPWRLLRDRLPTKANLVTHGILSPAAHFCVSGCGEIESAHHLFISCNTFGYIWALVRSWIVIPMVDFTSLCDHFVQFTASAGVSQARRSFGLLVFGLCGRKEITN
ncbi:hypothetical protein L195_g033957 [Trifolium pratense]|uniref:Reverse transcriptase zinc-binding domain-containing protein n=1 Tax=Trifolium pratense TaxID=57577 RepID=A0A2K3LHI2_TRIPR|nr:hypothetical protein L195_g033957 [Trifolium pratense]